VSAIQGRGLIAVAPIAAGELIAIKGGRIISSAALASLPEKLRNSEIQIAGGFHLAAVEEAEYEPVMLFLNQDPVSGSGPRNCARPRRDAVESLVDPRQGRVCYRDGVIGSDRGKSCTRALEQSLP
jgi:hypothetical protein